MFALPGTQKTGQVSEGEANTWLWLEVAITDLEGLIVRCDITKGFYLFKGFYNLILFELQEKR